MSLQAFSIHGHFYQPPREDPTTGEIADEPGAFPFRNWNERIHAHCYLPNAELGNFERISFDFGPALLNWMGGYDPITLAKIVAQERRVWQRQGVGNGMAQPYFHVILPLLPKHDKKMELLWGLKAFEQRFGHPTGGLWLPETAVDEETLEISAELGVEYTILAPWQASEPNLDVTQPYWYDAGNGRKVALFFYHAGLSTQVSFDPQATISVNTFVHEALEPALAVGSDDKHPRLVLIASDGELYGHHQPFRDHFLSHLTRYQSDHLHATHPGVWLRQFPPRQQMEIRPRTSWSCHHGLARWSYGCTCTPDSAWKEPFWRAMRHLGEQLDGLYLEVLGKSLADPWELACRYIDVLYGKVSLGELFFWLSGNIPNERMLRQVDFLLRAQLNKHRMYTSCGWFFEDFDRIEPQNNVRYAAQAAWWGYLATGVDLSRETAVALAEVRSQRSAVTAADVFTRHYEWARAFPLPVHPLPVQEGAGGGYVPHLGPVARSK